MGETFFSCHSFSWVFLDQPSNEVFGKMWSFLPNLKRKINVTRFSSCQCIFHIFSFERHISTQNDIGQNSQTPHITGQIVIPTQNFRSTILGSPTSSVHSKPLRNSSQTPIYQFDFILTTWFTYEHILSFNVSMCNFVTVNVIERL